MNLFSSFISRHPSLQSKRRFTLIELLVVIAIIAILAGMLLPALKQAKNAAHGIACTANEKQIGQAMYMYVNSFNEFIPPRHPASDYGTIVAQTYMWYQQLLPFCEYQFKLWLCPSSKTAQYKLTANSDIKDPATQFGQLQNNISIGINCQNGSGSTISATNENPYTFYVKYQKLASIKRPGTLIYAGDCTPGSAAYMGNTYKNSSAGGQASAYSGFLNIPELGLTTGNNTWYAAHNHGVNFLHVDGHTSFKARNWCVAQKYNSFKDGYWENWRMDKN